MNNFRKFAQFLLLTQTASDAGKYEIVMESSQTAKAVEEKYYIKDDYLHQAIAWGKKCPEVIVGNSYDSELEMDIVYFDIEDYGQVSFHSFFEFSKKINNPTEWCGIRGQSEYICRGLAKDLNLNNYRK